MIWSVSPVVPLFHYCSLIVEIYPTPMPPQYVYQQGPAPTSDNGLYLGALITYIVGMFTFLPYFISLVLTFVMVNKNLVQGGRKSVGMPPLPLPSHSPPTPLPLPSHSPPTPLPLSSHSPPTLLQKNKCLIRIMQCLPWRSLS